MRPQPYMKGYKKRRKDACRRNGLPQGKAHQLVLQHQIVSPEDIYASNHILMVKAVSLYLGRLAYTLTCT